MKWRSLGEGGFNGKNGEIPVTYRSFCTFFEDTNARVVFSLFLKNSDFASPYFRRAK